MTQSSTLVKTLKAQLKAGSKTYADVANHLQLSEASVKRLFADESFTIQRLESICHFIDLELSDLVNVMVVDEQTISQLSKEQEQSIASDIVLLLVTVCVINGYSYQALLDNYKFDPSTLIQKLAMLDKLKIIELLPSNRIKLLIAANFSWITNGPIQRFFQEKIQQDFFNTHFDQDSEQLIVLNGLLSDASNAEFQKRMRKLAKEFSSICEADKSISLEQRAGNTLVLALRSWRFSLYEDYYKGSSN
ncbi:MAG: DNA-binding Xre family transcriptional regulator [Oceanicoccus sp.]|jgi:DNA-binding Xre family transcriptional regulator